MRALTTAGVLSALLAVALVATRSGDTADSSAALFVGETRVLGAGTVRSWVALTRDGHPSGLGITFPEDALAALPADAPATLTLALPRQAAVTSFSHVEVGWMPTGGEAHSPFAPPHLDVRFFLVTPEEREAIGDSAKAARVPELDLIPTSYVPLAGLVPRVGAHWIDASAPAFNGASLTDAFLYGFYDGRMVFLESRLTRALLEGKPSFAREIKLPRKYARSGYYPTRYRVRYDASAREYSVTLEGLVRRP